MTNYDIEIGRLNGDISTYRKAIDFLQRKINDANSHGNYTEKSVVDGWKKEQLKLNGKVQDARNKIINLAKKKAEAKQKAETKEKKRRRV